MKPKVLIFIDTYAIGGPGKLILQFLKHGGKELCSPIVAGFWRGPEGAWQFRDAVESLDVRFEVLLQSFSVDPSAIKSAFIVAKESNVQILESHGYKAHIVCLVLSKLLNIPWVAYVHGWTSEDLKIRLYNKVEKFAVQFADRIVPVSRDLGRRLNLSCRARAKIVVIPNAIEPVDAALPTPDIRQQIGIKDSEILLGVIGRLSPEKGHIFFIQAFKILSHTLSNVKAIFVGDGQEREALVNEISVCGMNDKISLVGYQDNVTPYYLAMDVLVMPSLSEGMPMAALEAMSFSKPVVATNVGGISEVVQDGVTGYLVESKNPSALAEALITLLSDRQKMTIAGREGKRHVDAGFDPWARSRKITDMYLELLFHDQRSGDPA